MGCARPAHGLELEAQARLTYWVVLAQAHN
jgi:hypothetical protein